MGFALWEDCLVGQFFGPATRLAQVQGTIFSLWGRMGYIDVVSFGRDVFIFKFENPKTRDWVLQEGPWYISSRPILLQKWSPSFSNDSLSTAKFPLWIVQHGVPMELLSHEGLARTSAVGVPLYLDKSTELPRRIDIA